MRTKFECTHNKYKKINFRFNPNYKIENIIKKLIINKSNMKKDQQERHNNDNRGCLVRDMKLLFFVQRLALIQ